MKKAYWVIYGSLLLLTIALLALIMPPRATGGALIAGLCAIGIGFVCALVLLIINRPGSGESAEYHNGASFILSLIHIVLQSLAMYIMGFIGVVPFKIVVGVHAVMLILFIASLLLLGIGMDDTRQQAASEENSFVTRMRREFAAVTAVADEGSRESCDALDQLIKASPYRSAPETLALERSIIENLHASSGALSTDDRNQLLQKTTALLRQRNNLV